MDKRVRVVLEAFDKSFTAGFRGAGGAVLSLGSSINRALGTSALNGLRGGLGLLRSFRLELELLAYTGIRAFQAFSRESVALAAQRESQSLGLLNIFGGDVERQQATLATIKEIAKLPAIDFEGALGAFSQLASQDVPDSLNIEIIKEVANAIALAGGGAMELHRVMRGVTQMFGKGKVQAEELNLQILESAPLLRKAMIAAWGTANAEELGPLGMNLSPMEFWAGTIEAARDLPRAANATKNAIENVGLAWKEAKIQFGEGLLSAASGGMFGNIEQWLDRMGPMFRSAGQAIGYFTAELARLALPLIQQGWQWLASQDWAAIGRSVLGFFSAAWEKLKSIDWAAWGGAIMTMGTALVNLLAALAPYAEQLADAVIRSLNATAKFVEEHPSLAEGVDGLRGLTRSAGAAFGGKMNDMLWRAKEWATDTWPFQSEPPPRPKGWGPFNEPEMAAGAVGGSIGSAGLAINVNIAGAANPQAKADLERVIAEWATRNGLVKPAYGFGA